MGIIEFDIIPFVPQRFFWLTNTTTTETRGGHAHRTCEQMIICISGSVTCCIESIKGAIDHCALKAGEAIYLPLFHWLELSNFSDTCTIGVFASEPYNENDYIRSKEEFELMQQV